MINYRMRFSLIVILCFAIQCFAHGQDYREGQCLYTNAYSGLNVRSGADIKSEKLAKLDFGSEVEVIKKVIGQDEKEVWYFIDFEGLRGYVFGQYLQDDEVFVSSKHCRVVVNIANGLKLNAELVDSSSFDNKQFGERTHRGEKFIWDNGIQQIEHIEYEKFMSEFIIPRSLLTRDQVINVVLASFKNCSYMQEDSKDKISSLDTRNQINYLEGFSSIRIEESGGFITLKLRGGP